MNRKVVELVQLVDQGYDIRGAVPGPDGSIRLHVAQGDDARRFVFAFYEMPALFQATKTEGLCM